MSRDAGAEILRGTVLHPPALERAYREHFLHADGRTAAVVIGLLTMMTVPGALNDAAFPHPLSPWLGWLRAGVGLVGLSAIVACSRAARPGVIDAWVFVAVCTASAQAFLLQATRPPDYLLPIILEASAAILIWAVLPSRFGVQALSAALVTLEAVAWLALFRRPLSPPERMLIGMTLVAANAVGAYVSWRSHRLRRTLFLEQRRLVAAEAEARAQRAEVQRLSSLLPICMYCKKIRNDEGHWEAVEQYISARTDSKFSHGMCDECFSTHEQGD